MESPALNVYGVRPVRWERFLFSWRIGNLRGWLSAAVSAPEYVVPRKCMRPGSWDAATKRPGVTARTALLSP